MPLTKDKLRGHNPHTPLLVAVPVKAAAVIFASGIVAVDAGFAVPASDAGPIPVLGVAQDGLDNTLGANGVVVGGDGHGSQRFITVDLEGLWEFAVSGAAPVAGQNAYVVDDDTVSAAATANLVRLGQFVQPGLNGGWLVKLRPDLLPVA